MFRAEFWRFVKSTFYYNNNTVFIEFEIPFFNPKQVDLFLLRPKPIIWKKNAYLFNTTLQYAIIDSNEKTLFTNTDFYKNCLLSLNSLYCKTMQMRNNSCFDMILNLNEQNFDGKCFTSLLNKNMITQIEKQLYFTIFTPLDILISFLNFEYPLRIENSSKIIENIEYNISTSFFKFNTRNQGKYEIFNEDNLLQDFKTHNFEFKKPFMGRLFAILFDVLLLISIFGLLTLLIRVIEFTYYELKYMIHKICSCAKEVEVLQTSPPESAV